MSTLNIYSKEQADQLLSTKANSSNVYTKAQIDSGIYTKAQVNDALSYKANTSDVYTKTQTDALLGTKQDTLVSGTNIKTVNGNSILGSGDLTVVGSNIKILHLSNGAVLPSEIATALANIGINSSNYINVKQIILTGTVAGVTNTNVGCITQIRGYSSTSDMDSAFWNSRGLLFKTYTDLASTATVTIKQFVALGYGTLMSTFTNWSNVPTDRLVLLTQDGSTREYYTFEDITIQFVFG